MKVGDLVVPRQSIMRPLFSRGNGSGDQVWIQEGTVCLVTAVRGGAVVVENRRTGLLVLDPHDLCPAEFSTELFERISYTAAVA